jgi:hypothetical protein
MPHPNPHTMSTLTPHPTPPLNHACCHGPSKIQTKIAINITMAYTPRPALPQTDDPHLNLLYPLPPQSFPSPTLVPHPGLSYTAVNTINTLLSPLHPLPALHHGPLYPVASSQPHKTAEMPNNESRQSPELFWMKVLFNLIYLFTITHNNNPDLCTLRYLTHYIPTPPLSLAHSPFILSPVLVWLCEGTHGNALYAFPSF